MLLDLVQRVLLLAGVWKNHRFDLTAWREGGRRAMRCVGVCLRRQSELASLHFSTCQHTPQAQSNTFNTLTPKPNHNTHCKLRTNQLSLSLSLPHSPTHHTIHTIISFTHSPTTDKYQHTAATHSRTPRTHSVAHPAPTHPPPLFNPRPPEGRVECAGG